MGDKHTEINRF